MPLGYPATSTLTTKTNDDATVEFTLLGWLMRYTVPVVLFVAGVTAGITIASFKTRTTQAPLPRRPPPPISQRFIAKGEEATFLLRSREEVAELAKKYGPSHNSRYVEEWAVRDFFQDQRGGIFLDVGANHYQKESNTYFLETALDWSGVAVDALPEFGPDYAIHRPRTKFVAAFASDVEGQAVTLFEPPHDKRLASADADFTTRKGETGNARTVQTTTLDRILRQASIRRIDFLTMDIELGEPKALAGFDIGRYRPRFVCIEVHPEVRQEILDYFNRHQYVLVGKYLRIDPTNLYFQPIVKRH